MFVEVYKNNYSKVYKIKICDFNSPKSPKNSLGILGTSTTRVEVKKSSDKNSKMDLEKKLIKSEKFRTQMRGTINGGLIGLDPLGTIFTHYTNRRTMGGAGLKDVKSDSKEYEKFVKYDSNLYKISKGIGTGLGLFYNISSIVFLGVPIPQLGALIFDGVAFFLNKGTNYERFDKD